VLPLSVLETRAFFFRRCDAAWGP
jgi:hypothetical protein